jgi:hypothetical protein
MGVMTTEPHTHPERTAATTSGTLTISCDTCIMRATVACDDCMVTALYGMTEHQAVVLDLAEQRAVRLLVDAGMVPALRHREAI